MADVCYIPGPDPDICTLDGGRMTAPHRGRHSGLWIRTCTRCGESTFTTRTPPHVLPRGPIGDTTAPLPFESVRTMEPLRAVATRARAKVVPFDARMAQTGDHE